MYEWINTASGAITTNFFFRLVICVLVNFSLSPSFLQREEGPRHEIHRHVPLQEPRRDKTKTTGDHLSLEGHRSSPTGLEKPSGTGVESVATKSCRTAPFSLQWGSRVLSHQCSLQREKNKQTNKQTNMSATRIKVWEGSWEGDTHTHTHTPEDEVRSMVSSYPRVTAADKSNPTFITSGRRRSSSFSGRPPSTRKLN